jgi:thiamine-monophosphate kinase
MSNRTEISTLGEFGLIRHLTDRIEIKNNSTIKGVGDDAAILSYEDRQVYPEIYFSFEKVHLRSPNWNFQNQQE